MRYEKLSKLYYKLENTSYEKELDKRKNSYGSYLTPLKIRGFTKGKLTNESRYMIDKSMDYLVQEGYVEIAKRRPTTYKVCDGCLDHILSF